jgi:hypothetical protein
VCDSNGGRPAERVNVTTRVRSDARAGLQRQLRRDVTERTDQFFHRLGGDVLLRQAQVGDPNAEFAVEQDVGRLQIAMHDTGCVQRRYARANLVQDAQGEIDIDGVLAFGNHSVEGRARDELGDEIRLRKVLAEGVDHEHIGVIDLRHGARFLFEAIPEVCREQRRLNDLDGYFAIQPLIHRQQNDAHRAAAELALHAVHATDHVARRRQVSRASARFRVVDISLALFLSAAVRLGRISQEIFELDLFDARLTHEQFEVFQLQILHRRPGRLNVTRG